MDVEKRRDGKVKITLTVKEIFIGYRDTPEFKKLYEDLQKRNPSKLPPIELVHKPKTPITIILPSPEFCVHLLKNRRAWRRFLDGIRVCLPDAYGIIDAKGKRGRAADTLRETYLGYYRDLYPCIYAEIKKDQALARRIASQSEDDGYDLMFRSTPAYKNFRGLTRYVLQKTFGEEIISYGKNWGLDLLDKDERNIRKLGLTTRKPADPEYSAIALEMLQFYKPTR